MIDSHAHYTHKRFEQSFRYLRCTDGYEIVEGTRDGIFEEMKNAGITGFVEPAIDMDSNYRLLGFYEQNRDFMFPAVGVHPTRTFLTKWRRRKELDQLVKHEGVVAVGETGLDYHYPRKDQHRLIQKLWFAYQIKLAYKNGLPLILHIRSADRDGLRFLSRYRGKLVGGAVHCFNGDAEDAKKYLPFGLYFGIGASLLGSDETARRLAEAVTVIPLEKILLETDAPYVLPRIDGKAGEQLTKNTRNTSTVIIAVAEEIAKIKGLGAEEVASVSEENTRKLFGIQ